MVAPAPRLVLERVGLRRGAFALQEVSLELAAGDYAVLLGPTGCGKTLLAETICGLNRPETGRILIGGEDATGLDPARRGIGYVPQDYALLPFRTVEQNVALGLEARRLPGREIRRRTDRLLGLLGIAPLRGRLPARLSGGERQRTALARALAIEPALLILDEPLSALDETTGDALIPKMAEWHRAMGATTLHICHRLEEALALGSRLALMRNGRLVQGGTPEELAARPCSAFVAGFLRLPNRLEGEVRETAGGRRFFAGGRPLALTDRPPGPALGLFPMEAAAVSRTPPPARAGTLALSMTLAARTLDWRRPGLLLEGGFRLWIPGRFPAGEWPAGRRVHLELPETGWQILPVEDPG